MAEHLPIVRKLEQERFAHAATRERLKDLSLDILAWWKVVFGVDFVLANPGETPTQLAERARERIAEMERVDG